MDKAISMARSSGAAVLTAPAAAPSVWRPAFWTREKREEWTFGMGAMVLITILFAALSNKCWVPSGDGDLYVSIARSIALGQGFKFNGQFVNICPPGWPLVLAAVMKISPTFVAFKIVTITCMVVSLGFWFRILLRMMSARGAAGIVLLTALLNHVYSLTFWTHSEAIFCLFATSAMLFALQIAENRGGLSWRVPLVLFLCVGCVMIRWAGIAQCMLLVGILMHRLRWWRAETCRQWAVAGAMAALMTGTLFGMRHMLALSPQQQIAQREAGAEFDEMSAGPRVQKTVESQKVDLVNVPMKESVLSELKYRAIGAGNWFSWLFWQPFRFASAVPALSWTGIAVGWVMILAVTAYVIAAVRRREWIWLALAVYCAAFCLNWPNPNARYLVPVAPLLLLGAIRGMKLLLIATPLSFERERIAAIAFAIFTAGLTIYQVITHRAGHEVAALWAVAVLWGLRLWTQRDGASDRPRRVAHGAVVAFLASLVLVNGGLYAVDLRVARSRDFYARYEAGFNRDLVRACYAMNKAGIDDAELAVAERYVNLGKSRKSKYAVRAAVLLTGKAVQTVRDRMAGEPRADLLRWCQRRKVAYYLDQRPSVPWRVWHFVLPRSLNEKIVKEPLGPDSGGWVLYQLSFEKIPATQPRAQPSAQPTTLPGQHAMAEDASTTQPDSPTTQPGWMYRRSASVVELPDIRNWPKRVPGM